MLTKTKKGKSAIRKRSVVLNGHKTSVSLEDPFWELLNQMAREQDVARSELIGKVAANHPVNLSSALRLHVVDYLTRSV